MPGGVDLEEPFSGLAHTGCGGALPQSALGLALAAPVTLSALVLAPAVATVRAVPSPMALASSSMTPMRPLAVAPPVGVLPALSLGMPGLLMPGVEVRR